MQYHQNGNSQESLLNQAYRPNAYGKSYGLLRANYKFWYNFEHEKGGYVEKGENLGTAAAREVKEETGIDAKPLGLVTLRHTHPHPELSFPCKSKLETILGFANCQFDYTAWTFKLHFIFRKKLYS